MASPVNTQVKWARSTMPGAPTITGQVGSLASFFDAVLVNGWGSQTASSVVVSGGVATATFPTDHAAAPHAVVLVAGVTGTLVGLNGEQKVTAVAPNTVSWATAEANGTAAGTITVKMAPAGFATAFTGTNLRAYKSSDPQAHGHFLRVNDASAQFARVIGYENMTAISTGTGLFPSAAQLNGGYYWGKSNVASSAAVPWSFASDGRTIYLFIEAGNPGGANPLYTAGTPCIFGDMVPRAPSGDPYATALIGSNDSTWNNIGLGAALSSAISTSTAVPRAFGGIGTSFQGSLQPRQYDYNLSLPNRIDGSLGFDPVNYRDGDPTGFVRADLPGCFRGHEFGIQRYIPPRTLFQPSGSAKTFLLAHGGSSVEDITNVRAVVVDVTGPWR